MEALKILNSLKSVQALKDAGAEIFLVGGIIRDHFLNKKSKDIDIIVRNIEEKTLLNILEKFGWVDKVGESFGVIKFKPDEIDLEEPIDIAFPRFDRKATEEEIGKQLEEFGKIIGRGIVTDFDPFLTIEDDLHRRDITINSIAMSLDGKIIDPFNGMDDLKKGIIKATSPEAFIEDPLRMMRCIQFASRFNFEIDGDTWNMIVDNRELIKEVSGERIHDELMKIFEKGDIQFGLKVFEESQLRALLFPMREAKMTDNKHFNNIKTVEDFFFVICGTGTEFLEVLKGENDIVNGINALLNFRFGMVKFRMSLPFSKDEIRQLLFDAINKSKSVLDSGVIENETIRIEEFKDGSMPSSIKELAVNGHDLMEQGFFKEAIGERQRFLLTEIFKNNRTNTKEDLLKV